jgi:hypothetical protein
LDNVHALRRIAMFAKFRLRDMLAAAVLFVMAGSARASILNANPYPLPDGTGFDLLANGAVCVSPTECTGVLYVENLAGVAESPLPNGEELDSSASLVATFSNGATIDLPLVPGTSFDLRVVGGYDPLNNAVGGFPETWDSASFAGTDSLGNTITFALDGSPASSGSAIISPVVGGYEIDDSATIYAQVMVNGIPVTVPLINAVNDASPPAPVTPTPAPEPASLALLAVCSAGTILARRRRRRSA